MRGTVEAICISPKKGEEMQEVNQVMALEGRGLEGDRYANGEGSFNQGKVGSRQVTLINALFFDGLDFKYYESRRNIVVADVELMWLIGREFDIGEARFRGVKYCDPCMRPSKLAGTQENFQALFFDRGGLVAEVIRGGKILRGSPVIPPQKGY